MAGLQRFISYIYRYENDEKMANAGFAKVEVRGGVCRMEVHIRAMQGEQVEGTVYLFFRKERTMFGIPVGSIAIVRGNGDVRYTFETKDLTEFHATMEQIEGMFIPFSDGRYLASQWKEGEIRQAYFRMVEKGAVPEKPIETKPSMQPQTQNVQPEILEEDNILQQEREDDLIDKESADFQDAEEENIQNNPIHTTELPEEKFQPDESWERIFRRFRMQREIFFPFEGKQTECIRLELKDIKVFPEKYWYLGNNSFLLHGFFNYGHFILGEMNKNGITEYFIGVPGVFLNQERIMASMFGFPEFQAAANVSHKTGNFGYWYRII